MGSRPKDNRIAIKSSPGPLPVQGPYADPGPLLSGAPFVQLYQTTAAKVPIAPAYQDVRDVPILVGFDFRKRVMAGI